MRPVFKNPTINIGTIEPNSKIFIDFYFEGDQNKIVYVQKGCSCTGSEVMLENAIQFQFQEQDAQHMTKEKIINYPTKEYEFSKWIKVYFKSDDALYKIDENTGNKSFNSNKPHQMLTFTGKVNLSNLKFN